MAAMMELLLVAWKAAKKVVLKVALLVAWTDSS